MTRRRELDEEKQKEIPVKIYIDQTEGQLKGEDTTNLIELLIKLLVFNITHHWCDTSIVSYPNNGGGGTLVRNPAVTAMKTFLYFTSD